jgi:site-specific recombinase XerD
MTDITLTLEQALTDFLKALAGKNRSVATSRAYQTDIYQFITWLHQNNMVVVSPVQVERSDITEYLDSLAERKLSGGPSQPAQRACRAGAPRRSARRRGGGRCPDRGARAQSPAP